MQSFIELEAEAGRAFKVYLPGRVPPRWAFDKIADALTAATFPGKQLPVETLSELRYVTANRNMASHPTGLRPEAGTAFAHVVICAQLFELLGGASTGIPRPPEATNGRGLGERLTLNELGPLAEVPLALDWREIIDHRAWLDFVIANGISPEQLRTSPEYLVLAAEWRTLGQWGIGRRPPYPDGNALRRWPVAVPNRTLPSEVGVVHEWIRRKHSEFVARIEGEAAPHSVWPVRQFWADIASGHLPTLDWTIRSRVEYDRFAARRVSALSMLLLTPVLAVLGGLVARQAETAVPLIIGVVLPLAVALIDGGASIKILKRWEAARSAQGRPEVDPQANSPAVQDADFGLSI